MTCDGCKGAVTRILSKVDGVQSFTADVANKTVTVTGNANPSSDELVGCCQGFALIDDKLTLCCLDCSFV